MDRLYYCLTDKALKYASKSENKDNFDSLKQELALRFDLKDEPMQQGIVYTLQSKMMMNP